MEALKTLPMDGTFNQTKPLDRLVSKEVLYSFDLKAATDRWPLVILFELMCYLFDSIRSICRSKLRLAFNRFLYCVERVRPGHHFTDYAILGDDVIIADRDVAFMY
ncbi:hypothetical protein LOK49_LG06G00110 [Camellia lanceoleosa]|uniref:Uncharacterized protein n=1 Tax=Camellia lanceoleosa TaxID=1840588 RepID=A0ACC0HFI8_9ERIC|nr:hypothetical protein LOK49_LG06G00110 [Camellia lanceoleosa]